MDEVRSWCFLLLAGVAGTAYLWLSARNKQTPTSRSQSNHARPPLEVVYPGPTNAKVDIIAVHGLGSNVDWSWTWKDGENHINWLRDRDMLPERVPESRIMTYNYHSKWHADAPKTRLQLCGEELIHSIHSFRSSTSKRPIVFVGHSLGGNVIIHALLHAGDEYEYLLEATAGVVFLGTPLRGTKWQPFLDSLARLMGPAGSHRGITKELEFDGTELRDRLHRFCRLRNTLSMPVSCIFELRETDYGQRRGLPGLAKGMIVEEASACIPGHDRHGLNTDHLKINKYCGPDDSGFTTVSKVIFEMCHNANNLVGLRQSPKEIITDNTRALKHNPDARDCLRDLFLTDPLEDKKALKRKKGDRASGTCEWIMGTEELTAWLGSSQTNRSEDQATQVLWLHGNPGTGKSTMAIFLTEELSQAFSATDGRTLAYFFCDSAFDKRKTATSVIRGLLLQLVQQHPQLLDKLLPKYNERGAELFNSFDALWTIFIDVAAHKETGQKYCIIDALDECDEESQITLLKQLKETFYSRNAPPNVHILVTSRPYPEIREHMEGFANKDLASYAEAKQDIERCIEERTTALAERKHYTAKVLMQVRDILRKRAEGTFLWVGLACEELEVIPSKDAVQVLENMPKGLSSLYKRLFEKAVTSGGKYVKRVLSFVAVCVRPLSVLELSEACKLHLDEDDEDTRMQFMRDQIASCRLMVVIQDDKVLLLHQSVKDFLDKEKVINDLEAHAELAYRGVDLLIDDFHNKGKSRVIFLNYVIEEWPRHAHMAKSEFEVKPSQGEFFDIKSECRESWLISYQKARPYKRISRHFSIFHIAAKWGILALLDHLCRPCGPLCEAEELARLIEFADADDATPLKCAAESGHVSVIIRLLELGGKVSTQVVAAAANARDNGREVMALLLDRRGDQITVTEEVVKAAVGNWQNGKEVMALLLDRRGDQITVTEEVVKAAAGNYGKGKEVMALLLDRRGDQITVTEEVVKAAAGNSGKGKEVMALLLNQRGDQITVTEEVVKAIAGRFPCEIMTQLLDQRGDQVTVTEEVVKAAAGNSGNGKEVMALLLDRRGDQITVTKEVVKAAAGNSGKGKEVMALLLDQRGDQITVTEEVVKAAVGNYRKGKEVMALLLNQRGDQITVTEEVVKAIAGRFPCEIMTQLLDQRGDQVTVTEEVVKAAAGNEYNGKEVMGLLLDRRGDQITVTEEVVKAAAGNYGKGKEVMALLLDRRGDQITVTEEVVKAAAGNEENGKEVMALLLDRRGDQITVTEEVVKAAATCGQNQVLDFLSEQTVRIEDEWRCIAQFYNAAKAGDVRAIEKMIQQGVKPDVENIRNQTPLWIAASFGHATVVKLLAERKDVDVNSRSVMGESPLFWPASRGHESVVGTLMDAGADPTIMDCNGNTAITIARNNGHERIAEMLEGWNNTIDSS